MTEILLQGDQLEPVPMKGSADVLTELCDRIAGARTLIDVNIAAGLALEALRLLT